jgi:hypothetical protein
MEPSSWAMQGDTAIEHKHKAGIILNMIWDKLTL